MFYVALSMFILCADDISEAILSMDTCKEAIQYAFLPLWDLFPRNHSYFMTKFQLLIISSQHIYN